MRIALMTAAAAATLLGGCAAGYEGRSTDDWRGYRNYDYDRPDPHYKNYDAARYYRGQNHYSERRMSRDDRIYRGNDGRYYCRHDDGTTGLIVGALAGGLLGNAIAPGDSKTLGTILGAGAGAAVGSAVDKGDAKCR